METDVCPIPVTEKEVEAATVFLTRPSSSICPSRLFQAVWQATLRVSGHELLLLATIPAGIPAQVLATDQRVDVCTLAFATTGRTSTWLSQGV